MREETDVAIFWDIDKLPLPSDFSLYELANKITQKAHEHGTVTLFNAYSDCARVNNAGLSVCFDLRLAGVSFIWCSLEEDKTHTISIDMMTYAMDHPVPVTLIIISDDPKHVYAASILRLRKYHVLFITPTSTRDFVRCPDAYWVDWQDLTANTVKDGNNRETDSELESTTSPDQLSNERIYPLPEDFPMTPSSAARASGSGRPLSIENIWKEAEDVASIAGRTDSMGWSEGQRGRRNSSPTRPSSELHGISPNLVDSETHLTLDLPGHSIMHRDRHRSPSAAASDGRDRAGSSPSLLPQPTTNKEPFAVSKNQSPSSYPQEVLNLEAPRRFEGIHADAESVRDASVSSWATALQPSDEVASHTSLGKSHPLFQSLIEELREQPMERPARSVVALDLMKRDSGAYQRAGVSKFKDFSLLAKEAGVVELGQFSTGPIREWISLTPEWSRLVADVPASRVTSAPDMGIVPPILDPVQKERHPIFQSLIEVIRELGENPERTHVAVALMKRDPSAYSHANVSTFKQFTSRAVEAGIVSLSKCTTALGKSADAMSLTPIWQYVKLAGDSNDITPSELPQNKSVPYLLPIPGHSSPVSLSSLQNDALVPSSSAPPPNAKFHPWVLPPETRFKSLIEILQKQPEEDACVDHADAIVRLMQHDPLAFSKAGVTFKTEKRFEHYASLAQEAGVVVISEGPNAHGTWTKWISLNNTWRLSNTPTETSNSKLAQVTMQPSKSGSSTSFTSLVGVLREMRNNSVSRPYCLTVHTALIAANPFIYSEIGVSDFAEYASIAQRAGIVALGGTGDRQWVSLID